MSDEVTVTLKMPRDLSDWSDGYAVAQGGNRSALIRSLLLKERRRTEAAERLVKATARNARDIITLAGAQRLANNRRAAT